MASLILQSLYFFLPAYVANMAPVLSRKIPLFATPVSVHYFGDHKTWRGLIVAPLAGTLVFYIQQVAYNAGFTQMALVQYSDFPFYFGTLLGAGAILGDLLKSYYKRQAGIAPGIPWIPWDQLDFVMGALVGSLILFVPPAEVILTLLLISPLLHMLVNMIGYGLGINKNKF